MFIIKKYNAYHKKIKDNFGEIRINANIIGDKNREALIERRDTVGRWVEYIESLYKGDVVADLIENECEMQNNGRGDSILK